MPVQSQRLVRLRIASSVLAAVLCFTLPATAFAVTNAKIKAAQAEAERATMKLEDLQADLELRTEEYYGVEAELAKTDERIGVTERQLEVAKADLDAAKGKLNGRAGTIYRSGSIDMLAVLLGSTDFRDLVTRLDLMQRIGRSDASIVASVKDAKARTEDAMKQLERRREEQTLLRDQARTKQLEVDAAVSAQKSYLDKVSSQVRKLIAQERKRQADLAKARLAATSAHAGRGGRPFDAAALAAATSHPEAVDWAYKYVDKVWYVWGGTTPNGFDCSGLMMYCYAQLGISIPRTSRTQYHVGAFIPPDRLDLLMPGDLVFFGRNGDPDRIHHVAMYIGSGKMIEAPYTGQKVCVSSLVSRISRRGDYVGGVRP